jgi:hypothetical protein
MKTVDRFFEVARGAMWSTFAIPPAVPMLLPGDALRQKGARNLPALGKNVVGIFPGIMLLLCASLLTALETPSKPFLDKNSFYLSSSGFRVHLANDADGKKALHALPPHRFVMHSLVGGDVRYLYAEPLHCVCVFIGTKDAYLNYRAILSQPLPQADDVAPDYKTQANALLMGDPVDMIGQPPYAAEYFKNYY